MTVYNSIIFPFCFNEPKSIDLPGNNPLSFQQFPSAGTVQHSNCHVFIVLSVYQDQVENAYKKASSRICSGLYLHHWMISRVYFRVNVGSTCKWQAVKSKLTAQHIVEENGNMATVKLLRISITIRKVSGLWHESSIPQEKVMGKCKKQMKLTQEEARWERKARFTISTEPLQHQKPCARMQSQTSSSQQQARKKNLLLVPKHSTDDN